MPTIKLKKRYYTWLEIQEAMLKSGVQFDIILNVAKEIIKGNMCDVVEVVRCKDCKYYKNWDDGKICMRLDSYYGCTRPWDYCSYGERREDGRSDS